MLIAEARSQLASLVSTQSAEGAALLAEMQDMLAQVSCFCLEHVSLSAGSCVQTIIWIISASSVH